MARPIKKNADYFPHYLPGKHMKYIRKKYGHIGYAVWFIILEQLTQADDHHLKGDEFNLTLLADECAVSFEFLHEFIPVLCSIEKLDSELWNEAKIIYSEKLRDSVSDAYKRRANDIITTAEIRAKYLEGEFTPTETPLLEGEFLPTETPKNVYRNTQSKVKESKVKQSREKREQKTPLNSDDEIHPAAQKKIDEIHADVEASKLKLLWADSMELFQWVEDRIRNDQRWWLGLKSYTKTTALSADQFEKAIKLWASWIFEVKPFLLTDESKTLNSLSKWMLREKPNESSKTVSVK